MTPFIGVYIAGRGHDAVFSLAFIVLSVMFHPKEVAHLMDDEDGRPLLVTGVEPDNHGAIFPPGPPIKPRGGVGGQGDKQISRLPPGLAFRCRQTLGDMTSRVRHRFQSGTGQEWKGCGSCSDRALWTW